jgi:hypothetical protein
MRTCAIICYVVAAIAEIGGWALVVLEFRDTRQALQKWLDANPANHAQGSYGQHLVLNDVMIGLLGSKPRRLAAATLIAVGIIAGTLGNFASLPSG